MLAPFGAVLRLRAVTLRLLSCDRNRLWMLSCDDPAAESRRVGQMGLSLPAHPPFVDLQ
jgi:hypothetical protein